MNLLPQAMDVEQAILGSLLFEGDRMADVIEILPKPEMFYKAAHRNTYKALMKLYADNTAIDILTVSEEMARNNTLDAVGGRVFLIELAESVATAANVVHHARIITEKYRERGIYQAAREIQQRIKAGETEDLQAWASEKIFSAGRIEAPTPALYQQVDAVLKQHEKTLSGEHPAFHRCRPQIRGIILKIWFFSHLR